MRLLPHLTLATAVALGGCAEYDLAGRSSNDTDGAYDTADYGSEDQDSDGDFNDDTQPPEQEDDFLALFPAQTDVFVFIANPLRDTVTRVNVYTLEVRTTEVGNNPRVVKTTPDYTTAVSFNMGDDSVTIIDALTLTSISVDVRQNFNNMVMSPDGAWVGIWHDRAAERPDDPPVSGLQSFNEVSFVHLPTGTHFPMAVDYNPSQIKFTDDSTTAVVVSNESIGIIDLTETFPTPSLVGVALDPLDPPIAEEVVLTPDNRYAFVRQFGATELVIVDMASEVVSRVPVGTNPTDLDLSPDGTQAVVVSRGSKELYVFDTTDPFLAPTVLPLPAEVSLGSVTFNPIGNQAILYTTAALEARYAVWDLDSDAITLRSLVKPVKAVAITPTGETLLVMHTKDDAIDANPNSPFKGFWALSLIDLGDFRANPLRLPAEPIGFANSQTGDRGYFIMEGKPFLEELDYRTLLYNEYDLRSNPVYLGVLPDLDPSDADEPPAWVSQEHPLGRISFFDADDTTMETITGFELNSGIEE